MIQDSKIEAGWVPVVDYNNSNRLLGYLTSRPKCPTPCPGMEVSYCLPPLPLAPRSLEEAERGASPTRVRFTVSYMPTAGGWVSAAVLGTRDPLEALMRLDEFVLPGESTRAADCRRIGQRFGR